MGNYVSMKGVVARTALLSALCVLFLAPTAHAAEKNESTDTPASASTADTKADSIPSEASKVDEASKNPSGAPGSDGELAATQDTTKNTEKESPKTAEEEEEDDGSFTTILVALMSVGAAGGGFYFLNNQEPLAEKARKKGSAVLILGPANAGKTALYLTLKDGGVRTATTTSMEENEGTFKFEKYDDDDAKPLHVIDFPGDPSLSYRLPHFYPVAKVMVFMVDANDRKSIEREAAEIMFRMLTNPEVVELSPTIIVACNKSDLILASKPALLKKTFETELQKLTVTQGLAEDSVTDDADTKETIPLGIHGEAFEFEKHSPCAVDFMKCSVNKGDLSDLVERIRDAMEI